MITVRMTEIDRVDAAEVRECEAEPRKAAHRVAGRMVGEPWVDQDLGALSRVAMDEGEQDAAMSERCNLNGESRVMGE